MSREGFAVDVELISRVAAIDALTNTNLKRNLDSVYDGDMNRTRRAAQRVIAQLPTIDAIPIPWLIAWCFKRYMETEVEVSVPTMIEAWWKEQEWYNETR